MAVLIGAVPPLDAEDCRESGWLADRGVSISFGAWVLADRAQFFRDLSAPFYGFNRPGRKGLAGPAGFVLAARACSAGHNAAYDCIKAFSETDFTEDLKKFDVPTLVLHGDDDQIVPIAAAAMLSSKMIKGATLRVIPGAPHGMCSTLKDRINEELLEFFKRSERAAA